MHISLLLGLSLVMKNATSSTCSGVYQCGRNPRMLLSVSVACRSVSQSVCVCVDSCEDGDDSPVTASCQEADYHMILTTGLLLVDSLSDTDAQ